MTPCATTERIQDFLDDDLSAAERRALREHLDGCVDCRAELTAYASLFTSLRGAPLRDPGPALTERVLDRVLPSRLRRRMVTAVGWSYTALSAISTYLFVSWIARPATHVWLAERFGEAYLRLFQVAMFTLHSLVMSWLRLVDGWGTFEGVLERLAPLARALILPFAHPVLAGMLWAAVLASMGVFLWMRQRRDPESGEVRHVGLLGF